MEARKPSYVFKGRGEELLTDEDPGKAAMTVCRSQGRKEGRSKGTPEG